jgi:hypothetical protein
MFFEAEGWSFPKLLPSHSSFLSSLVQLAKQLTWEKGIASPEAIYNN